MSGMVRTDAEVGEQQLLAAWVLASAVRFNCHKNGINVFERLRIVGFQNPALLADVVFVEDSETPSLLLVRPFPPPSLERARVLNTGLCVQIESIKDQPFRLCVKDAAVRPVRPLPGDVMHVCHIEITSAHQLADVPVMIEQLLTLRDFCILLIEGSLAVPRELHQLVDLRLKHSCLARIFITLCRCRFKCLLKLRQSCLCS